MSDARDAVHLTRLLRLHEVTAVVVPSVEQEIAEGLGAGEGGPPRGLMRVHHIGLEIVAPRHLLHQRGGLGGGTRHT